ncbi:MAG TPA: helicase HerA-like domain-containing protein, partial [Gammaproteobacteria bacterium]|nr:helicase HerA-like domain-containing protein [Gammaproteobacteria bacterium]
LGSRYDQAIDRKSAYETLKERADKAVVDNARQTGVTTRKQPRARSNRQGVMEAMIKSVVRSIGSSLGRRISRGILGSILKG